MFPFDLDDEELEIEEQEKATLSDYEIDYETGRLTGRIVTGIEAIKQWAKTALSVDRYRFPQYSWDYGTDLSSLVGGHYDPAYVKSEVVRMISDALSTVDEIEGIEDVEVDFEEDRLTISFRLVTTLGETEVEADVRG